ncbi:MAG: VOC family protein [Cyanobacteria bacterium SZAS LIN-2]|nr:VOC family protein [Cyanobacteria bacterium SZAS LIN-2]
MAGKVKAVPDGYHTATPYLVVDGAARAIEFYKKAFGATEVMRLGDDKQIMHAEIKIGDSPIMLADEYPDMKVVGPHALGGTPVSIMLYVDDVDAMFNQAVAAGATVERAVENQFYGDRSGGVRDPFGHRWYIATHVEDVSPEEIDKRAAAMHQDKDCAEA